MCGINKIIVILDFKKTQTLMLRANSSTELSVTTILS
mgnify:FL=1